MKLGEKMRDRLDVKFEKINDISADGCYEWSVAKLRKHAARIQKLSAEITELLYGNEVEK